MAGTIATLRAEGAERFEALGYPGKRAEMWKYTDVRAIAEGDFAARAETGLTAAEAARVEELAGIGPVIVLKNGILQGKADNKVEDISGLSVRPAGENEVLAASVLEHTPDAAAQPFAHLNAARMGEPVLIDIAPNAVIEKPVHLVFFNGGGAAIHARVFVRVGTNAEATLLESHYGEAGGAYFANPVVHLSVESGARLHHYRKQAEGEGAYHIAHALVGIGRDATYESFALSLGAELARHEIDAVFHGSGGSCTISGAYLSRTGQHLDTTTRIEHVHPDCRSREVYHGVAAEKGRGVFQGSIYVHPEAQRTDGHQLNRAVLLGPGAEIDAKPQLEIYADDVKCSHGCTAGQLDEQALFYLRSRGISEQEAKALLLNGFLAEAMEEIADERVREDYLGLARAAMTEVLADA